MFFTGPAEFGGISSGKISVAPDGIPGGRPAARALRKHLAAFVAISAVLLGVLTGPALARQGSAHSDNTSVQLDSLPREAQETQRLILSGGPFPFAKDGSVFGNRERALPPKNRGHYREYTVVTPGSRDRGARRIICGGTQKSAPEACYYTADHYNSFRRIER